MPRSVRVLACGALVVGGASLAVALPGGAALAKSKTATGACTSLSGNESSQVLSGCTDTADTGGQGSAVESSSTSSTITWVTGLTTTESFTEKESLGSKDKCPAVLGDTAVAEVKEKGKITGGTATDLVGGRSTATICVYSNSSGIVLSLFPHSKYTF